MTDKKEVINNGIAVRFLSNEESNEKIIHNIVEWLSDRDICYSYEILEESETIQDAARFLKELVDLIEYEVKYND